MAVFDVAQSVVAQSAGLVQGTTDITPNMLANMQATIEEWNWARCWACGCNPLWSITP